MPLSSRGCYATVKFIRTVKNGIVAEFTTSGSNKYSKKKKEYVPDFTARALFYDKGEQLNTGDVIYIKSFYLKNRNERLIASTPSVIVTEWVIHKRNQFIDKFYGKKKAERDETARLQRQAIEEEIKAEEQDLDEYIDSIDENNPF